MKLTSEEKKVLNNPKWRLDNLYWITNKQKQKVRFQRNTIQKILQKDETRFNVILKARQMGVSTYYLLKYLDIAAFQENQTIAILSHDRESLRKLFKIIRYAHKMMNPLIKPVIGKGGGSQYKLYFPETNSEIGCTLEAVSEAVSHLHISEMALMENKNRVWTSIDSVPIEYGQISIETTARGYDEFYDFWIGNYGYTKFFFPWFIHKEYQLPIHNNKIKLTNDELLLINKAKKLFNVDISNEQINFRRFKIAQKKGDIRKFLQEFPEDDQSCFITTGNPAIDPVKLRQYIKQNEEKPIEIVDEELFIYANPIKNRSYCLGADTAEGVNSDFSVGIVLDASTREQVAMIRGQFKPYDFAHKLNNLGQKYNNCVLAVERNNHGHAVLLELEENIRYSNLYRHKDGRTGWLTDRVTRPIMIDTFIEAIENFNILVKDKTILNECLTLIDRNNKIQAAESKFDDCVIASCIALQMLILNQHVDIYKNIEQRILL